MAKKTLSGNEIAMQQERELPLHISKEICEGRTYIVTGANVGLGLEAARHLVAAGAGKVVMAVRNINAGEEAKKSVESSTGITGVAEVWRLDLASYDSVQKFASKAIGELGRIEAVIENAAVAVSSDEAEGHRIAITVNVISTFLLAVLLLPKLRADAAKFGYTPRLSIVTSTRANDTADAWSQIADDPIVKMDNQEEKSQLMIYPLTKLLDLLGVRELANLLPVSRGGVIINSLCPGLCETSLSRNAPPDFKDHLKEMWAKIGRTAECGSRTLLSAAVAGQESHGSLMSGCVPANHLLAEWINATADQQAWDAITKELEKIEPGCVAKALQ